MKPRALLHERYGQLQLNELAETIINATDIEAELIITYIEGSLRTLNMDISLLCSVEHNGMALRRAKRVNASIAAGDLPELFRRGRPTSKRFIGRRLPLPMIYAWERLTGGEKKRRFLRNHPRIRLALLALVLTTVLTAFGLVLHYGSGLDPETRDGLIEHGVKALTLGLKDYL